MTEDTKRKTARASSVHLKQLVERIGVAKAADATGVTPQTVNRAVRDGECSTTLEIAAKGVLEVVYRPKMRHLLVLVPDDQFAAVEGVLAALGATTTEIED